MHISLTLMKLALTLLNVSLTLPVVSLAVVFDGLTRLTDRNEPIVEAVASDETYVVRFPTSHAKSSRKIACDNELH